MLRHLETQPGAAPAADAPSPQAVEGWSRTVGLLHDKLSPDFMSLFPSVRAADLLPPGTSDLLSDLVPRTETDLRNRAQQFGCDFDVEDGPTWQMLTALAVASDASRQERLLAGIRNKIMDNITAARKKTVPEPAAEAKLVRPPLPGFRLDVVSRELQRNVNSLLRGLGLDASMITLQ